MYVCGKSFCLGQKITRLTKTNRETGCEKAESGFLVIQIDQEVPTHTVLKLTHNEYEIRQYVKGRDSEPIYEVRAQTIQHWSSSWPSD